MIALADASNLKIHTVVSQPFFLQVISQVDRLVSKRHHIGRKYADDIGGLRGVLEGYMERDLPPSILSSQFCLRRICSSLSRIISVI